MKRAQQTLSLTRPVLHAGSRQRGIALVMVLWLVVLLTIVAASFATQSRVETRMAGNLLERQKARALLQTGFSRAMMELMVTRSEERWRPNGEEHEMQLEAGTLRLSVRSAAGLVDLNRASRGTLEKLFALIAEDRETREALLDALYDWRDTDDLRRINGAEESDYEHAGLDYGTPDRDLESVDELGYVMGFDRDAVNKLRPYVTIYSDRGQVDENFAAQDLIEILQGSDVSLGDQVAQAFDQLDSELADINDSGDGLDATGQSQSVYYRISIEATTEGGGRSAVDVDVEMSGQRDKPFKILAWQTAY